MGDFPCRVTLCNNRRGDQSKHCWIYRVLIGTRTIHGLPKVTAPQFSSFQSSALSLVADNSAGQMLRRSLRRGKNVEIVGSHSTKEFENNTEMNLQVEEAAIQLPSLSPRWYITISLTCQLLNFRFSTETKARSIPEFFYWCIKETVPAKPSAALVTYHHPHPSEAHGQGSSCVGVTARCRPSPRSSHGHFTPLAQGSFQYGFAAQGCQVPPCSLTVPDQLPRQKIPLTDLATDKAKLSKSVLCSEHRKGGFFIITVTFQVSTNLVCLRY